jgi:DNA topoisomerase VI subunit B
LLHTFQKELNKQLGKKNNNQKRFDRRSIDDAVLSKQSSKITYHLNEDRSWREKKRAKIMFELDPAPEPDIKLIKKI